MQERETYSPTRPLLLWLPESQPFITGTVVDNLYHLQFCSYEKYPGITSSQLPPPTLHHETGPAVLPNRRFSQLAEELDQTSRPSRVNQGMPNVDSILALKILPADTRKSGLSSFVGTIYQEGSPSLRTRSAGRCNPVSRKAAGTNVARVSTRYRQVRQRISPSLFLTLVSRSR